MKINGEFEISFDSKVSKKGWTNFRILRANGSSFKSSFSVTRQEFGKGKPFVDLPLEVQQKAHVAAMQILIERGLVQ